MKAKTAAEWETYLQARHVPAGRVRNLAESLADPQVRPWLVSTSQEPVGNTPDEFAKMIREEDERLTTLVRRFPIE